MPSVDPIVPVTPDTGVTEAQVYAAIADVLDPELDEPLVALGFIDSVQLDGPDVTVVFKLPTFWCSPNFAYLMAGDLRTRIRALPGVRTARVTLLDHCTQDEVTNGVNRGQTFAEAFAGEITGDEDLEELRHTFLRKGFLMRQDALLRQMLKAGLDEATILALQRKDVTVDESADRVAIHIPGGDISLERAGQNAARYLRRAVALGLPHNENDPLIIDEAGQPVAPSGLQAFLRLSRSIRFNIAFNTSLCTSLFRTRYEQAGASQVQREEKTYESRASSSLS